MRRMRELREIKIPRGAVAILCGLVLIPPAAMALGHTTKGCCKHTWYHHHTRYYTTSNEINQSSALRDRAWEAADKWDDDTALEFDHQTYSHVSQGASVQSHIQLVDGNFGNTGWRASTVSDSNTVNNAGYHKAHTHINFNLDAIGSSFTPYDKRALACREFGQVVGVATVSTTSDRSAHGTANDCMSFGGTPTDQTSKDENSSNYTYTDYPGWHTVDLISDKYREHEPDINLLASDFKAAIDVNEPLTAASYTVSVEARDRSWTGPDAGVETVEVFERVEGPWSDWYSLGSETTTCATPGSCVVTIDVPIYPDDYPAGSHALRVVATDQLGLSVSEDFAFEVAHEPDPPADLVEICDPVAADANDSERLMTEANPEVVDEIGRTQFGSRFGGSWVDHSVCPTILQVGVKNATSSDATAFEQALASDGRVDADRMEVTAVPYTEDALEGAAELAADVLEDDGENSYFVAADVVDQTIEVETQDLSPAQIDDVDAVVASSLGQAQPRAKRADGSAVVDYDLRPGAPSVTLVHSSRSQFPPYEAGLNFWGGLCTSGFTMRRQRNFFASTAGHCLGPGEFHIGGTPVGWPVENSFWPPGEPPNHDGQLIELLDRHATRRIYTGGDGGHRAVTDKVSDNGFIMGRTLCFQGIASGADNCGPIDMKILGIWIEGSRLNQVVCIAESAAAGDSGGPVYAVRADGSARAAGLVSFVFNVEHDRTCFGRIGRIADALNAQLAVRR